jgi:hypothetical protein
MGENFYLKADSAHPVKLWMKDFDNNGAVDKIFTRSINGKDCPVFTKKDIIAQIPSVKKLNLRNEDYASKTIQDLFGNELESAIVKKVNYTASCVAYNDGKGYFTIKKLPLEVQLSSMNATVVKDVNHDNYPDIIEAGNWVDLLPQFSRVDASYGNVLINDGKGNFSTMPASKTGLFVPGETRDIISFKYKNEERFLFLENDDYPVMYKWK